MLCVYIFKIIVSIHSMYILNLLKLLTRTVFPKRFPGIISLSVPIIHR